MTALQLRVLRTIRDHPDCGAHWIEHVIWPHTHRHMTLRAGQYVGKLVIAGYVRKELHWYTGKRGHQCYCGTGYYLTPAGRQVIKDNEEGML